MLVGEFHTHAHRAQELRASTLSELLARFDVYRRPQRFEEFIAACEMDARGRHGLEQREYPQANYLRGAASAARAVAVQPLLEGLQGCRTGRGAQARAPESAEGLQGRRGEGLKQVVGVNGRPATRRAPATAVAGSAPSPTTPRSFVLHPGAGGRAPPVPRARARMRSSAPRHGQHQAIEAADQIAIEQHIDVQRQALAVWRVATVVGLDELETAVQLHQRQVGVGGHHQVVEGAALDAHRLAFEYRRAPDVMEKPASASRPASRCSSRPMLLPRPSRTGVSGIRVRSPRQRCWQRNRAGLVQLQAHPGNLEFSHQQGHQPLGEGFHQLELGVGSERLDALGHRGVVQRMGQFIACGGRRLSQPICRSRRRHWRMLRSQSYAPMTVSTSRPSMKTVST